MYTTKKVIVPHQKFLASQIIKIIDLGFGAVKWVELVNKARKEIGQMGPNALYFLLKKFSIVMYSL